MSRKDRIFLDWLLSLVRSCQQIGFNLKTGIFSIVFLMRSVVVLTLSYKTLFMNLLSSNDRAKEPDDEASKEKVNLKLI